MIAIEYESAGTVVKAEREMWHDEKDGFVVAFNESDTGVVDKIIIPKERVIRITE